MCALGAPTRSHWFEDVDASECTSLHTLIISDPFPQLIVLNNDDRLEVAGSNPAGKVFSVSD